MGVGWMHVNSQPPVWPSPRHNSVLEVITSQQCPDILKRTAAGTQQETAIAILFGGQPSGNDIVNDLYISLAPFSTWQVPVQSGVRPLPREGHCSITMGCQFFTYGGAAENSIWQLSIPTFTWKEYAQSKGTATGTPPRHKEQRYYAGLATNDNKVNKAKSCSELA